MLPQIYTANHATFPIQIRKITVQIFGNFWVTQQFSKVASPNLQIQNRGKLSIRIELFTYDNFEWVKFSRRLPLFPLSVYVLFVHKINAINTKVKFTRPLSLTLFRIFLDRYEKLEKIFVFYNVKTSTFSDHSKKKDGCPRSFPYPLAGIWRRGWINLPCLSRNRGPNPQC